MEQQGQRGMAKWTDYRELPLMQHLAQESSLAPEKDLEKLIS